MTIFFVNNAIKYFFFKKYYNFSHNLYFLSIFYSARKKNDENEQNLP